MLEFIVLGQIPGTNIYISFSAIAVGVLCGIVLASITFAVNKYTTVNHKAKQQTITSQAI